ncbi:MAG: hypothetical protein HZB51_05255 [Chloroflexi bacterium]|nr:hypothetical protein [Chloroflexota bacterium]
MSNDFYGLRTQSVENQHLRLEFLADAGPRIVRVMLNGSNENQLAELPDIKWDTPNGDYFIRGGHRLWVAPEVVEQTYIPDNSGLQIENTSQGVRLIGPTEVTGIRKSIDIQLHADAARVTLVHRLQNESNKPIDCAAWAITMFRLGGTAILPLRKKTEAQSLLPDRSVVLWQYAHKGDSRLYVGDENILIEARAQLPPCKIGTLNVAGWLAYLRGDIFFVKRFQPQPNRPHVDRGSNAEIYCNDRFMELETLAPFQTLQPNETVEHIETWEWRKGVTSIEQINEMI